MAEVCSAAVPGTGRARISRRSPRSCRRRCRTPPSRTADPRAGTRSSPARPLAGTADLGVGEGEPDAQPQRIGQEHRQQPDGRQQAHQHEERLVVEDPREPAGLRPGATSSRIRWRRSTGLLQKPSPRYARGGGRDADGGVMSINGGAADPSVADYSDTSPAKLGRHAFTCSTGASGGRLPWRPLRRGLARCTEAHLHQDVFGGDGAGGLGDRPLVAGPERVVHALLVDGELGIAVPHLARV